MKCATGFDMEQFALAIKGWYRLHRRHLPWRETTDPYKIWISEIILQQTRVVQGHDYFLRFVERFPTVRDLAEAPEDEVLKLWQGLGYYSRARNLHASARMVMEEGGVFPVEYEDVRRLKGVGDYTAAAICSFAYGRPYAVVDGNVCRVLSRWLGIDVPIDTARGKKIFATVAQELLDKEAPSLYNQAIMDFGALQCVPQAPDCPSCPLRDSCVARKEKRVTELPVKQHKTRVIDRYFNYIYVRAGAFTFIRRRNSDDIWRGLYEFPLLESPRMLRDEELYTAEAVQAWIQPGEKPVFRCLQRHVRHVLSHRVLHVAFHEAVLPEDTRSFAGFERISSDSLELYAVPRLLHRFMERFLTEHDRVEE